MRDELIKLITVTGRTKNRNGFETEEEYQENEIFAESKSVRRTEYYAALQAGVRATQIFGVHPEDYQMGCIVKDNKTYRPSRVIHEGTEYRIVRTYCKSIDSMEITCEEVE